MKALHSPTLVESLGAPLLAGAALLLATTLNAAVIITPNGQSSTEGNSNNTYPFDIGAAGFTTMRYQQVYSASDFAGLGAGEFITQIAFRPDGDAGRVFSSTLPDVRIDLSTTAAAPDALSLTFASNVGANDTIVYGGLTGSALSLSSSFTGPIGGPMNFDIIINLTTPFFYNGLGNLLLDVQNFGGGTTTYFDAENFSGDSVSRVLALDSSATGSLDTWGLVTQFTTSRTVPEPSTLAMLGLGGVGFMLLRRRKSARSVGGQTGD